jgi:hypothetical protein
MTLSRHLVLNLKKSVAAVSLYGWRVLGMSNAMLLVEHHSFSSLLYMVFVLSNETLIV